jgi:anti-sigma factor RsiW
MRDTNERPVCHRAEDLVSYLYGEASQTDAFDFVNHLRQCDACRSEFAVFNQVHDSIQLWRNEALGESFNPAHAAVAVAIDSNQIVRHERKLSAIAALREFFSVSPLWLRGATAFAALLLCAVGVMMIARVVDERKYTQQELDTAVGRAVDRTKVELTAKQNESTTTGVAQNGTQQSPKHTQVAANQIKNIRPRGLNRQEREQLAADLRLTLPADEDELLLALPEQDKPNQ